MSQNYFKSVLDNNVAKGDGVKRYDWRMVFILLAWVTICFFTSQILLQWAVEVLLFVGVPLNSVNTSVLETVFAIIIYLMTITFVIFLPYKVRKIHTTRSEIGVTRLPKWSDILLAPAGLVIYLIASSLLILLATKVLPWFNVNQVQSTGFGQLSLRYEYILAFLTLVVVAPIAEEIIFRGYLYGKLKKYVPAWVAIIATSLLFGAIHGAWNVFFDTFALSIVLCILREFTENIWSSILLHMLKNGIAFFILFIYPTLLTTLVK
jgi:membrane protease YdiL (CAAX protease family)